MADVTPGAGDPSASVALSPLIPDVGCGNRQNWRCDVAGPLCPSTAESRLLYLGYRPRCRHPALRVFRHRDDHEIAWVVTTGRVQIRLATSIERPERRRVARHLYAQLTDAVDTCRTITETRDA